MVPTIQNPNEHAGVVSAQYTFSLYDSKNILIVERTGTTYIMPGGITPIFTAHIDTGNRIVAHTSFAFTDPQLAWQRMSSRIGPIGISSTEVTASAETSQVSARVGNTGTSDMTDVSLVAVVFDTTGNAIAASGTLVSRIVAGAQLPVGFTWPEAFSLVVGHVDILPLLPPLLDASAER
jgi:hypothetical protein